MKQAIEVGPPDWRPLEAVFKSEIEAFMYMGRAGGIALYKHRETRRYLNIETTTGRFYRYTDAAYVEIDRQTAFHHVFGVR
jgi:hypothetical protein